MRSRQNSVNLIPSSISAGRCISAGLLLALASAFPMTDPAFAETYTLTGRTFPTEAGINGLPAGKTYCDLTSADTLNVTANAAQLYFISSADVNCNIVISGKGQNGENTGKIRMQGSGTVVNLNGMVTLAGDTTVGSHNWDGTHGSLYFNGQITGSGAFITAPGARTNVYLNNQTANRNDYAGNTQIGGTGMYANSGNPHYGGTVILQADDQIPDGAGKGNLVLMSWEDTRLRSKLDLNGHTETVNGLISEDTWSVVTSSADGGKLIVGANDTTSEYRGVLEGSMSLEKIGSGSLTLSGTNTYTGGTTITAGTLKLTGDGTLGTGAVTNNAVLELNVAEGEKNFTSMVSGTVSGSGQVVKSGDGTLKLNSTLSHSGGLTVNDGKLIVATGKNQSTSPIGSGTVTVESGAVIEFQNSNQLGYGNNPNNLVIRGTLKPANYTHIKNVTLENGTIDTEYGFTSGGTGLDFATRTGVITSSGDSTINSRIHINNGANVTFDVTSGTLTVNGIIKSDGGFTKTGEGTLTLTAANTYSKGTTISAGTLKLTGVGTLGTGAVTNNAVLEFAHDSDMTFSNAVSGTGSVIKTGAGTLTINKTSSMNGEWRLNAGKVVITSSRSGTNTPLGANKAGSTVYVNDGVELVLSAQDVFTNAHETNPMQFVIDGGKVSNSGANYNFIENTTFKDGAQLYAADGNATWKAFKLHNVKVLRNEDGTAGAPVVFSADMSKANATYAFGTISDNAASTTSVLNVEDITSADSSVIDNVSDLVISGVIADPLTNRNGTTAAAPIEKTGAGTLEFSAANTYTGTTTISAGTLKLTGAGTLGTSAVTLNENGTLELNVADGAEKSFTNKVTGTGTVAKTGAGTLKLNTANGFESTLNISEGRADVFGTMAGKISVADGAVFSPGDGIGTLTINNLFSADAGARLVFELGGDTSDLLVLSGDAAFDISEDAAIEFLFTGDTPGSSYTLIEANDDLSDLLNAEFWSALMSEETAENWHLAVVGNTLQLLAGAGTGDTSLPEPATWVLLVLGASGLYCVRRRNRK